MEDMGVADRILYWGKGLDRVDGGGGGPEGQGRYAGNKRRDEWTMTRVLELTE